MFGKLKGLTLLWLADMSKPHPIRQFSNEPAVVPRYVTRFNCLGGACPDTCCSGWNIFVDQASHNAYAGCQHSSMSAQFKQHLKPADQATVDHASTILRDETTGGCPFLSDGWCGIQSTLGEAWLSDVCASYPRLNLRLGDLLFQSMSLSCPEAARLALTEPDAFDFVAPSIPMRQSDIRVVPTPWALTLEQMQNIHFMSVQVVRTTELALWERLICTGLLCENLRPLFAANHFDGLDEVLGGIQAVVQSGELKSICQSMAGDPAVQAAFFRSLWGLGSTRALNPVQAEIQGIVDRAALFDLPDAQHDPDVLTQRYLEGVSRLRRVEGAQRLMEHAVINDMLQDLFPFSGAEPMQNFLKLISRFGLLRWILAQVSYDLGEQCTLTHLVQATQQFHRRFRHNPAFGNVLHDSMTKAGWNTLEKAVLILKVE